MKIFRQTLHLLAFSCILISCGGNQNQKTPPQELKAKTNNNLIVGITKDDHDSLFQYRSDSLQVLVNGQPESASLVDVTFSLPAIMLTIQNSINSGMYSGLRFYPALKDDNTVYWQVAPARPDTFQTGMIYSLENSSITTQLSPMDSANAAGMRAAYTNAIVINQQRADTSNIFFKRSSYMSWLDLVKLCSDNISGWDINDTNTFANYSLVVEHGYTTLSFAQNLYATFGDALPDNVNDSTLVGHFPVFHILENPDNNLIDPTATRSTTTFTGRLSYMKLTCPTQCN